MKFGQIQHTRLLSQRNGGALSRPAPPITLRRRARSSGRAYIRRRKIIALEQARRVAAFGERISGAIADNETRFRIEALAVALESQNGKMRKLGVMRDDLSRDEGEEVVEVVQPVDASAESKT